MGHLLGNAVRFGVAHDVMAAGEGIETMLSLRCVCPTMPMVAALSAAHLAAILFPATLRRLYIARDDDPAGDGAMASLIDRAHEAGIEAIALSPTTGRLQRGSPHARHRRATGSVAGAARPGGRRPLHGTGGMKPEREMMPRRRRRRRRIGSRCFPVVSERTAPTAF